LPVRPLNSSVLRWPDPGTVDEAVRRWAQAEAKHHRDLRRLGYFGSYARGDWGVGSDLDLVAVVADSQEPFERRGLSWNMKPLPVPAELLVYTQQEWTRLHQQGSRFIRTLSREAIWIYEYAGAAS
jgi:hypothetical protein